MSSYLITGAARGLGLNIAVLLAAKPASEVSYIFATARKASPALEKLAQESNGRVVIIAVEVTNKEDVQKAAEKVKAVVGDKGLDVLINNAGVMNYSEGGVANMTDLSSTLGINVDGVHTVIQAFLPLLRLGQRKEICNMGSTMGSITRASEFMFQSTPAYKISKAALNMLMVQYSLYLAEEGFISFSVDPGWVQTDMGSSIADLTVEQGCQALLAKIDSVTKADNGKFFDAYVPTWEYKGGPNRYDGKILPF